MPSDAVPILVPGPKVQHGVLSLQTAHANEAAYADGRRGFEWRNGGGTEPERASAGYTLAIQHRLEGAPHDQHVLGAANLINCIQKPQ